MAGLSCDSNAEIPSGLFLTLTSVMWILMKPSKYKMVISGGARLENIIYTPGLFYFKDDFG